jgi:hypothetical protein
MDIFDFKTNDQFAAVLIHGRILGFYQKFQRVGLWFLDNIAPNLGPMMHVYSG